MLLLNNLYLGIQIWFMRKSKALGLLKQNEDFFRNRQVTCLQQVINRIIK